jgi:hypothetical protein
MSDGQITSTAETPGIPEGKYPFGHMTFKDGCTAIGFTTRKGEMEVLAGKLRPFWIGNRPHLTVAEVRRYLDERIRESEQRIRVRREQHQAKKTKGATAHGNEMEAVPA